MTRSSHTTSAREAGICSSLTSTAFHVILGRYTLALRYNDDTTNITVDIPEDPDATSHGYPMLLKAMGEVLCHKLARLTISSDNPYRLIRAVSPLCSSVTNLSLQSWPLHNGPVMRLLSDPHAEVGWFFPLLDRVSVRIGRSEQGGNALHDLVRASTSRRFGRRPTRLTHALLNDGWIHTDTLRKIEDLGVQVELHEVEVSRVSPDRLRLA